MENPLVSVIIITYNQQKYIRAAIDSVLAQNIDFEYELIISDDKSTDNTPEIIKEYATLHSFIVPILSETNLGASKNYMNAVKRARGEFVVVFEGDDYWIDSGKLQKQVNFLRNNSTYFAVSHVDINKDDSGNTYGYSPNDKRIIGKDASIKLYLKAVIFSCMSTMYRNIFRDENVFIKYYNYVTAHRIVADFALRLIFLENGKVKILSDVMSVYRVSGAVQNTTSYNFNTSLVKKLEDHMFVVNVSDKFYNHKYNFLTVKSDAVFHFLLQCLVKKDIKTMARGLKTLPANVILYQILYFPPRFAKALYEKITRKEV